MFRLQRVVKTWVYGLTRAGRIIRVAQRLPRGTNVFGLPDGYVVMKEVCGNPVVAYLPPVPSPLAPTAIIAPPVELPIIFEAVPAEVVPIAPAGMPASGFLSPGFSVAEMPPVPGEFAGEAFGAPLEVQPPAVAGVVLATGSRFFSRRSCRFSRAAGAGPWKRAAGHPVCPASCPSPARWCCSAPASCPCWRSAAAAPSSPAWRVSPCSGHRTTGRGKTARPLREGRWETASR